eukprot:gene4907-6870_t
MQQRRVMPFDPIKLAALEDLLFPNRTRGLSQKHSKRELAIPKTPYVKGTTSCSVCTKATMSICKVLIDFKIEEKYYPSTGSSATSAETCKVIDALGKRVSQSIFGVGKTFRDTAQCRDMVMQYLCYFYGSDNPMYQNNCINEEDVADPISGLKNFAPRPPCKSFCVQVATVCANERDYIHTCNNIVCPQNQGECVADPKIDSAVLAANLGCDVPYYADPYFAKNSSTRLHVTSLSISIDAA